MAFWNKEQFELLNAIAEDSSLPSDWSGYREYCGTRARGLRGPAFKQLNEFIADARRWPSADARTFVAWLMALPQSGWAVPHPLLEGIVKPVLREWKAEEPTCALPHLWLGLLERDAALLALAAELDPSDPTAAVQLADWELDRVEWVMHHLGESVLLCSLDEALESAEVAQAAADGLPECPQKQRLLAEVAGCRATLQAFGEYIEQPIGSFPEWLESRGQAFEGPTTVYYER